MAHVTSPRRPPAVGARLVHVSTDFVFDGDRPQPYGLDAATGPVNVYGRSKLAGEEAVLAQLGAAATVVRTSWVYAATGSNFVLTMLNLMRSRESARCRRRPGRHADLGRLAGPGGLGHRAAGGPVQECSTGPTQGVASWYDFAVAIQEEALARGLLERADSGPRDRGPRVSDACPAPRLQRARHAAHG